jgi:hypothetical protein
MKPKSPSLLNEPRISFPYLPLYLPDLRYMVALAKEKGFNCAISDDEHEYEDLEDLIAHCGVRVHNLVLRFSKETSSLSYVRVAVTSSKVVLTSDSSDEYVALEQRFRTYLKKRAPWFAPAMNTWIWIVPLGGLFGFVNGRPIQPENHALWNVLALIMCVDVAMLFISLLVPHYLGGVHLKKKDEVAGFFAKYEKLIIAIVSAAIGVAGKWLLDHKG